MPAQPTMADSHADTTPSESRKPRLKILVVDDNHDSALSMAMMLTIMGHETRTAHDGEAAVSTAETFRPQVILLDIGLPKLNGYEVAQQIRQHDWGTGMFLIAVTGWGQDEDRQRSEEVGLNLHMVKPVEPAVLEDLLANLDLVEGRTA